MKERWKPVVGFDGLYEVSDRGRVRSLKRRVRSENQYNKYTRLVPARLLMIQTNRGGYFEVCLWKSGRPHLRLVHHLVLGAFVRDRPGKNYVARHLNGDRKNNTPVNLEWGTHKQNVDDSIEHGTWTRGTHHGMAKLTDAKVKNIRIAAGTQRQIAKTFGVCQATVWQIKRNNYWKHVQ